MGEGTDTPARVRADEIPGPGEVLRTFVAGVPVALWNVDGRYCAVADICPHRGHLLSDGNLVRRGEGVNAVCPGHGWEFSLDSGQCETAPERIAVLGVAADGDDLILFPPR